MQASRLPALAALAAVALASAACGPDTYDVRGVVVDVAPDERVLMVEHEAIPGFMDAMTMGFDVSEDVVLEDLAAGQQIEFRIEHSPNSIRITRVEVVGQSDAVRPSPLVGLAEERTPAPEFSLVDQDGEPLSLDDLRGRAVLLDFVFTNCNGPCPILTSTRVALQDSLPPEVRERTWFVSISIDPERDSPEALRGYAEARGADLSDWSFLTGPPEQVLPVVKRYGVAVAPGEGDQLVHTLVTFLIDPEGRIARRYLGLENDPQDVLRDLRGVL